MYPPRWRFSLSERVEQHPQAYQRPKELYGAKRSRTFTRVPPDRTVTRPPLR
jgi:hypothetical protein